MIRRRPRSTEPERADDDARCREEEESEDAPQTADGPAFIRESRSAPAGHGTMIHRCRPAYRRSRTEVHEDNHETPKARKHEKENILCFFEPEPTLVSSFGLSFFRAFVIDFVRLRVPTRGRGDCG
jgi:hypothetical protein